MKTLRSLLVFSTLVLVSASASVADAFDGAWWGAWPFGGWGCYGSSVYNSGKLPVPPYFAVHPPVYYGQKVRGNYGDSPYAQPASRWTQQNSPVIIVNPFVAPSDGFTKGQEPAQSRPQMIENPFYQPKKTPAT